MSPKKRGYIMKDNTYNGWTNWETWNTNLWLEGMEFSGDTIEDMAYEIETYLTETFEESPINGLFGDFVTHSLNAVNFEEIAETRLAE